MNSREIVRCALNHKEQDLIPIDFGAMRSTGISAIAYNKLKEYLNINSGETRVYDIFQQLAEPEEEIVKIMGADVVQLHRYEPAFGINIMEWKEGTLPDGSKCMFPKDYNPVVNAKGEQEIWAGNTLIAKMPEGGIYFDVVNHPYWGIKTFDEIDNVPLNSISETEIDYLKKQVQYLYENTDKAILGSFGGSIFETGQLDWGYEEFFINLALEPDLMHYYFDRITNQYILDLIKYLDAVGDYIDVIQLGDDLGTQETTQVSVDMYRQMIKPYHSKLFRYIRNNYPNVRVFLHSCGAIYDLIPDLIDAGVEVLNPIQLSAKGMEPVRLKREFGKDLTFWGGGCNMQTTATFGTIDDISREVRELIKIFAPGGGFVFNQVHNIQANISPKKIMAIYNTAQKYRNYPVV